MTVLTPDARGNVQREEVFGGDSATLAVGTIANYTPSLPNRAARTDHQYPEPGVAMVRRSLSYDSSNQAFSFYTTDADVDGSGFLVRVRDTADVSSEYRYDSAGRIEWELPTGRAWTKYVYPNFSTTFDIIVETYKPGTFTASAVTPGVRVGRRRFLIDGIGRVTKEFVEMPGGTESRREFTLNALGWQVNASELGTTATLPLTSYTYDSFGRVLSATAPDGSISSNAYTGIRKTVSTSKIATAPSVQSTVAKTEEYDVLRRLIRVTEKSGPTSGQYPLGQDVITEYAYDLAGHLTAVTMNKGASVMQQRRFDYDGRGFLRWESQPESGVSTYTYDGRGQLISKRQASVPGFDLQYTYDGAGRIEQVAARDPFNPAFRPLKVFTYATANSGDDLRKGKLHTATRYNYGPEADDPHLFDYRSICLSGRGRPSDEQDHDDQSGGPSRRRASQGREHVAVVQRARSAGHDFLPDVYGLWRTAERCGSQPDDANL
jgi:YD repeat-containing protein